jgi:hypothetical protein
MRSLEQIKTEIQNNANLIDSLKSEAVDLMVLKFKDNEELKKAISDVENSKDLTQTSYDEWFSQYVRFYASEFIDTDSDLEKEAFREYLKDFLAVDIDYDNDALLYNIGPCLLINEDGDVLDQDSGKWIIEHSDYNEEKELYSLIETHMEKTGYFPSVVRCDRYGNAFYVNTKGEK